MAAQNRKEHPAQVNDPLEDHPPEIPHKAPVTSHKMQGVANQDKSPHRALAWVLDTQIVRSVNGNF
jgi:hypothetical protein